ncbi:Ntn hydrolase family protein [Acetobacter persici]|uniref:hypothetical protein n=1 Tax=Acetobacter persici TaxID=1076596 RepID=UPI001F21D3FA|nr:hypothetical protein [Acetobacter persici]MCG0999518.1 hypothetical protein [Acetobacter persici]
MKKNNDDFQEHNFDDLFGSDDDGFKKDEMVSVFDDDVIKFFKGYLDKNKKSPWCREDEDKIKVDELRKFMRIQFLANKVFEKEKFDIAGFILDHLRPVSISLLIVLNIFTSLKILKMR